MKTGLRVLAALIAVVISCAVYAQDNYTVDKRGNVVFSRIVENLPLEKADIFNAAKKYIVNAYKETKYTIADESAENGSIGANGEYVSFFESNSFTTGHIFNAEFILRVNAQDGRARIQIIARNYKSTSVRDLGDNKKEEILISAKAPLSDDKDNKKMYSKAFESLRERALKTIGLVEESLKSAMPSSSSDDEW